MTEQREARIREVAARRQFDLTIVLENVHDPHNISAVLRSCDAIGLREVYVLYSEPGLHDQRRLRLGKKTSGGASKWVEIHFFTDTDACFREVRQKYDRIWATHLAKDARSLYEADFTSGTTALVFGNEHDGVGDRALSFCNGNLVIPTLGMVESLNISVACAVTLFEAMRQKRVAGHYGDRNPASADQIAALTDHYLEQAEERPPKYVYPKGGSHKRG